MTTDFIDKLPPGQAKGALAAAIDKESGLDLLTLSTVFVQSGFFSSLESVAQGVVKILAGRELGFPALASVRHIYVHNGHIGLQATLIATKIRQSGVYDYKILESTDEKCVIEFQRKRDGAWLVEGQASFTIEEARRAKLVKTGSGWENYPSDMLFARAITRGQRRHCPDVFGQTVYSEEEVREIAAAEPKTVGGQTIEERIADLMPKEKVVAPGASEPVASNGRPSPEPPATAAPEETPGIAEVMTGPAPEGIKSAIVETEQAPPPASPQPEPEPPAPPKLTFTVGKETFHTNGVTRAQLMELFKICPRVDKKYGAGRHSEVLRKEFGLEHRVDLTEEQAERYYIRMKEMLEGSS